MAKIKTTSNTTAKEKKPFDFMAFICGAWLITITAIMPIFLSDAYARVLQDKYGMLLVASGILVGCFVIWALFDHRIKNYFDKAKSYANPETGKWFWNWCKATFNCMDVCVLALALAVVISTLLSSPYMYQCFFGNEGRYCGALFWIVIIVDYFIITRNLKYKSIYMTMFLVSAIIISVWAISDYFNVDWIKFKYWLTESEWWMFISTIGNINSYSAYAAIPLAISAGLFVCDNEKSGRKVFYAISYFAIITSIFTANSDNGYLALFALYMAIPFVALSNKDMLRRYIVIIAIGLTAFEIVSIWNTAFSFYVLYISGGIFGAIESIRILKYLTIIVWIIVIVLYILEGKNKDNIEDKALPKCLTTIWIVFACAVMASIVVAIVIANSNPIALPSILRPYGDYLVLDDDWGIYRVYIWKLLLKMYGELPLINKLFGIGVETAQIHLFNSSYYDVAATTLQIFDSPHNELLQMLLSMGVFGFASFVGTLISPLILAKNSKKCKSYPIVLAIAFMALCHIFECAVTISTPIEIPVWFAFLMVACNLYRNKEKDI